MFRILLIESNQNYRRILSSSIIRAGYDLQCAETIKEAVSLLETLSFEMIITAFSIHGIDGIEFTRMIRSSDNDIPIIIVSDVQDHRVVNQGLLAGADDFMKKPIEEEEFILRIKAILHRSHINDRKIISIGTLIMDYDKKTIYDDGNQISLPRKEFDLLFLLLSYPNQLFSREMLLNEIWGPGSESEAATVSVHMNRLRKHFHDDPNFSIMTVRGCGYKAVI